MPKPFIVKPTRRAGVLMSESVNTVHETQVPLGLLEGSSAGLMEARSAMEHHRCIVEHFESLGDNCEFGLFQRRMGLEPISLLRWAHTPPNLLVKALRQDFDGVGTPEQSFIELFRNEYRLRDRQYRMRMHTFIHETDATADVLFPKLLRRLTFLREKMLENLRNPERIFVYKSAEPVSDSQALELHDALCRHAFNRLFVVRQAMKHTPGTALLLRPGLAVGYIRAFKLVNPIVDDWLDICTKALHLLNKDANIQ